MTGRYSDFEELRPTGEAVQIPDEKISTSCGGDPRRQRVAASTGGYPEQPPGADHECRSCGASIPASQTKCRFCLANHLGDESADPDDTTSATLLGIVHMFVKSSTYYGALAKGSAAAMLLASNEAEQAVDDCTLIYDLDEDPAPQLADQWPTLPTAVQIASGDGERLLAAAQDRIEWSDQPTSDGAQEGETVLYDERGGGIRDEEQLTRLLDDTDDEVWLVPAIALQHTTDETGSDNQEDGTSTGDSLECQQCGRETGHRFSDFESLPDETWSGQPIWECDVCGTNRYGPTPT
ncbi:biosurfactant protein 1 [Halogranum rubrum]|nr:hypothetical protein [Halogranum rubrum]